MPANRLESIDEVLLLGPGPSPVYPEIYRALSTTTLGHLDPNFIALMDEIKALLQKLLNTTNELTIPISGTGSAGMEACFVNLVEPGDKVLVLSNGVFGGRMQDVATRLGALVDTLDFDWGTPVLVEQVEKQLAQNTYDMVAVVHAETSTGVGNPVADIGALLKDKDTLFLVDGVTSLGGMPVELDAWGVDAFYSGTQKCLSCPPGLAPLSFSPAAVDKLQKRESKVPNWYLDLSMITGYWSGAKRSYHHTAPINMLYGLYQALYNVFDEGVEKVFARHQQAHQELEENLSELGLEFFVAKDARLPMLNAIKIPEGIDDATVRSKLLNDFQIEIGGGLGPLAGQVWRVGLMGHGARSSSVERLCTALKSCL